MFFRPHHKYKDRVNKIISSLRSVERLFVLVDARKTPAFFLEDRGKSNWELIVGYASSRSLNVVWNMIIPLF